VHGVDAAGYWFWGAGIDADIGPASLSVGWFGADAAASELFYDNAVGQRWAATARWRF
jgi:hypothetical protein